MHDGTAVDWGHGYLGGDSSSLDLTNVADAMCGIHGCVARKHDGTAVTWGDPRYGGDSSTVDLTNVASAMCGWVACVAIKHDASAVTWGHPPYGGDSSSVDLTNVAHAMCSYYVCVAVKRDGTAVTWGYRHYLADASNVDLTNLADVAGPTPTPTASPRAIIPLTSGVGKGKGIVDAFRFPTSPSWNDVWASCWENGRIFAHMETERHTIVNSARFAYPHQPIQRRCPAGLPWPCRR